MSERLCRQFVSRRTQPFGCPLEVLHWCLCRGVPEHIERELPAATSPGGGCSRSRTTVLCGTEDLSMTVTGGPCSLRCTWARSLTSSSGNRVMREVDSLAKPSRTVLNQRPVIPNEALSVHEVGSLPADVGVFNRNSCHNCYHRKV